jgi:hypothetical protein
MVVELMVRGRGRIDCLRGVVVGGKQLGEGVSQFKLAVKTNSVRDGPVEGHEEAWVLVIVLGNWGVIEVGKSSLEHVSEGRVLSLRLAVVLEEKPAARGRRGNFFQWKIY